MLPSDGKRMFYDSVCNASLGSIQHSGFGFPPFGLGWCRIAPAASMRRFTRLNASILRQKSDALALSLGTTQKQTHTASNCQNGSAQLFESLRDEYRPHPGNRTERKEDERSGVVAVQSNLAVLGHSLA